jgi:hypothetical protein
MDTGPEKPAETPRSSASVEGFDEMCDAPLVASELASTMVISRFWGSFPELVSKIDVFEQLAQGIQSRCRCQAISSALFPKPRIDC